MSMDHILPIDDIINYPETDQKLEFDHFDTTLIQFIKGFVNWPLCFCSWYVGQYRGIGKHS